MASPSEHLPPALHYGRAVALTLSVILLDQVSRAVLQIYLIGGASKNVLPFVTFHTVNLASLPISIYIPALKWSLPLLLGLFALHLFRLERLPGIQEAFAGRPLSIMGAGFAAIAIDLTTTFPKITYAVIHIDGLNAPVTLPVLFTLSGAILFSANYVYWRRTPEYSLVPLTQPDNPQINLSRLRKGIDNIRIDVLLHKSFLSSCKTFSDYLIRHYAGNLPHDLTASASSQISGEHFKNSYIKTIENALYCAKQANQIEIAQLAQLAAIKYVSMIVEVEYEKILQLLRSRHHVTKNSGVYEHARSLASKKPAIVATVIQRLFDILHNADRHHLSPVINSLFGINQILPRSFVYNPLLTSKSPGDDHILLQHYLLLSQRSNDETSYGSLRQLIDTLVYEKVSAFPSLQSTDPLTDAQIPTGLSWLDVPTNIDILFGTNSLNDHVPPDGTKKDKRPNGQHKLQRYLRRTLHHRLASKHIIHAIVASYYTQSLHAECEPHINPHVIHQFLAGNISYQAFKSRFRQTNNNDLRRVVALKRAVFREIKHRPEFYILKFLRDFSRYRHDLQYYKLLLSIHDQLNLLTDEREVRLSRANNTLYDFSVAPFESFDHLGGHVILKADIRGSTSITAAMLEQGLNPATHFSKHFFNPIEQLLEVFGGNKVFVEGDAIILSFSASTEYKEFPVSRACGIARSIVDTITLLNRTHKSRQLPPIEIGIGITHEAKPPTYLFDGDRPIMISPAIGKADRLSSCTAWLRKLLEKSDQPFRIAVFQAANNTADKQDDPAVRYNVNGIELDAEAFKQLAREIELKLVRCNIPGTGATGDFFIGNYPDLMGAHRQLAIRQDFIRLLDTQEISSSTPTQQLYYEVISDPAIMKQLAVLEKTQGTDYRQPAH